MYEGTSIGFPDQNSRALSVDGSEVKVTAGLLEQMSNITPSESTKLILEFLDGWLVFF